MHSLIDIVAELILHKIALRLHITRLYVPLFEGEFARVVPRKVIVIDHVSEVVQGQIVDLNSIFGRITQIFGRRNVIELPMVRCGEQFESIFHKVTIKVHEKTTEG